MVENKYLKYLLRYLLNIGTTIITVPILAVFFLTNSGKHADSQSYGTKPPPNIMTHRRRPSSNRLFKLVNVCNIRREF